MIDHTSNPSPGETETGKSLGLARKLSKNNRQAPGQYKTTSQNTDWERVPRLSPGLHMHNSPLVSVTHPQARTHPLPPPHTHTFTQQDLLIILDFLFNFALKIEEGAVYFRWGQIKKQYWSYQVWVFVRTRVYYVRFIVEFRLLGVTVQLVSLGSNHLAS